jgi:hypothetical protein
MGARLQPAQQLSEEGRGEVLEASLLSLDRVTDLESVDVVLTFALSRFDVEELCGYVPFVKRIDSSALPRDRAFKRGKAQQPLLQSTPQLRFPLGKHSPILCGFQTVYHLVGH